MFWKINIKLTNIFILKGALFFQKSALFGWGFFPQNWSTTPAEKSGDW